MKEETEVRNPNPQIQTTATDQLSTKERYLLRRVQQAKTREERKTAKAAYKAEIKLCKRLGVSVPCKA